MAFSTHPYSKNYHFISVLITLLSGNSNKHLFNCSPCSNHVLHTNLYSTFLHIIRSSLVLKTYDPKLFLGPHLLSQQLSQKCLFVSFSCYFFTLPPCCPLHKEKAFSLQYAIPLPHTHSHSNSTQDLFFWHVLNKSHISSTPIFN